MIRIWLLVALVACSKAPRAAHEEAATAPPVTRPIDAQVDGPVIADAPVLVDAQVLVDAGTMPDAAIRATKPDAGVKPDAGASGAKLGKAGDVCAYGRRNKDPEEPFAKQGQLPACGPGLMCCYPCGIPGCDSVCKTSCPAVP